MSHLGVASDHTNRVASMFARISTKLGYFKPDRRLTELEWNSLDVESWATERERVARDVEKRFGAPSYRLAGQCPGVFGYADDAWLYFDFDTTVSGKLEVVRLPIPSLPGSVMDLRPGADDEEGGPEDAYREFLIASLSGDRDRLLPLILAHENPEILWQGVIPRTWRQFWRSTIGRCTWFEFPSRARRCSLRRMAASFPWPSWKRVPDGSSTLIH
jgi:hypothetical protein